MPSQATITGVVGPGLTATATVFSNMTAFRIDCANALIRIEQGNNNKITDIDITGKTTITCTVSSGNYTLSVS